ncbi:peptidoglycan-binding protein [Salipiger sp. IMCC34102]|uniref:peptidoglycan-binding domain-containing protein n=1 Tax=Salipiger sp. IMCC34102 TaxID=2510647 RepID=UPI00101B9699|nr:peptidoglycan-binding protein [Salipiger sp. IMCC34102]RYH01799.1 peptidoglycan-binding protein [Salipiger sp. IMCC34102]
MISRYVDGMTRSSLSIALLAVCAACAAPPPAEAPVPMVVFGAQIEVDATGTCYARADAPRRVDVVDTFEEVRPARRDAEGRVIEPAVVRKISTPREVVTGEGTRFEAVCPPVLTEDYVASLQRALLVRRAYAGPITGDYDGPTQDAVRLAQRTQGIDSAILSVATARSLGLTAVPLE